MDSNEGKRPYVVIYTEAPRWSWQAHFASVRDSDEAEDQCVEAHPSATIVGVYPGETMQDALIVMRRENEWED